GRQAQDDVAGGQRRVTQAHASGHRLFTAYFRTAGKGVVEIAAPIPRVQGKTRAEIAGNGAGCNAGRHQTIVAAVQRVERQFLFLCGAGAQGVDGAAETVAAVKGALGTLDRLDAVQIEGQGINAAAP